MEDVDLCFSISTETLERVDKKVVQFLTDSRSPVVFFWRQRDAFQDLFAERLEPNPFSGFESLFQPILMYLWGEFRRWATSPGPSCSVGDLWA